MLSLGKLERLLKLKFNSVLNYLRGVEYVTMERGEFQFSLIFYLLLL